jgi:peptidoglycan lytic transglycosylase
VTPVSSPASLKRRTPSSTILTLLVGGILVTALLTSSGCTGSAPRFATRSEPGATSSEPLLLEGNASYYAEEFHGRQTSSGEIYDMHALTAAHRTLPFNTLLRVTSLSNGKSVVVRVNDRGPFKEGRIIDLSLEAAKRLSMTEAGTAAVKLEIISGGSRPN